MSRFHSLLSDEDIIEECAVLVEKLSQGQEIQLGDVCARLGISIETALAFAGEHASRLHGRPMTFIKIDRRH